MEAGDTVTIYEDPLTEKREEGKAKLLLRATFDSNNSELEYWKVEFLTGDCKGFQTYRKIKKSLRHKAV